MAGLASGPPPAPGVERSVRWRGDERLVFYLNHTDREQVVTLEEDAGRVLLGEPAEAGRLRLAPRDVAVLVAGT